MRNTAFLTLVASIFVSAWLVSTPALANQGCEAYSSATQPYNGSAAVVPPTMLVDQASATECLIEVISRLGMKIYDVKDVDDPETQLALLSVTSALRRMIAEANSEGKRTGETLNLLQLIDLFRRRDNIGVISVLSYGARSDNRDLRLNSVLILGNVIDNSTVCVPLAHLNDATLLESKNGQNGRANLLGVVSVVAPWAYEQNFESIQATADSIENSLKKQDDSSQTLKIIKNIELRLADQKSASNKELDLSELDAGHSLRDCHEYVSNFGLRIVDRRNLYYSKP